MVIGDTWPHAGYRGSKGRGEDRERRKLHAEELGAQLRASESSARYENLAPLSQEASSTSKKQLYVPAETARSTRHRRHSTTDSHHHLRHTRFLYMRCVQVDCFTVSSGHSKTCHLNSDVFFSRHDRLVPQHRSRLEQQISRHKSVWSHGCRRHAPQCSVCCSLPPPILSQP